MHNTAGAIIVAFSKAVLVDDNMDAVGAGASGMGGMVKGRKARLDRADTANNMPKMCVHIFFLIHFVSHSHGTADDASLFTRLFRLRC